MSELTFISNKTRKETFKYILLIVIAFFLWILQVSIFSRALYFDTSSNIMFLGAVYFGLTEGPLAGTLFGITTSFLSTSILYDHIFYISYPLIGLLSGLSIKNIFSDNLLLFILSSFVLSFLLEFLNGWQFSLYNPIDLFNRYLVVGFNSAILNLCLSPFFYYIMRFVTKKLVLRQNLL